MVRFLERICLLSVCCGLFLSSQAAAQFVPDQFSPAQFSVAQFDDKPAAVEFPYVAYVGDDQAYVRSGPGQRHYPTGRLPVGSAVEVFRHDDGGWCAVRPPQGQHSLIATRQLRRIDAKTAEVIDDGAVARVGSLLSPQKSAVQVMFQRGELVQLVNSPAANGLGDQEGWTRIAPPAGEFRWVAAAQLSRQPPTENLQSVNPQTLTAQSMSAQPLTAAPGVAGVPNVQWQTPPTSQPAATATPNNLLASLPTLPASAVTQAPYAAAVPQAADERVEILPGSPAELQLAQYQQDSTPAGGAAAGADEPPPTYNQASGAASSQASAPGAPPRIKFPQQKITPPANPRVAELQVRLSREVIKLPKDWSLFALREETAVLLANEQDAPAREQYRDLLNRIAIFEQVQQRYAAATVDPAGTTLGGVEPVRLPQTGGPQTDSLATGPLTTSPLSTGGPTDSPDDLANLIEARSGRRGAGHTPGSDAVLARIRTDLGIADPVATPAGADPFETTPTGVAPIGVEPIETAPTATEIRSLADASDPTSEAQYDAVGTLKPVVSRREGAPRYALVDEKGDVVSFVTPSPDVNLQRYVGRRIGIQGARGFMPDYRRSHVTASRVNMLGTTRR